jgi:hypothetical protein
MRKPRALALKVAALQVGQRVVQPAERQVVQPVEPQVVRPAEARQVVPLVVQPVLVRQAQLEQRVLLEQRVPQVRLLVRSPGLLALSAWSAR